MKPTAVSLALIAAAAAAAGAAVVVAVPAAAQAGSRPVAVLFYDGIGTTARARLWGRALVDRGLDTPRRGESLWSRLRRSYRLLESDELPYAVVEVRALGKTYRVKADKEGLFSLTLSGPLPVGAHRLRGRVLGLASGHAQRSIDGKLFVYPKRPGLLVISDIDDTVLRSGVARKAHLIWQTISSNVFRLKTFAGAPLLFGALHRAGAAFAFVSGSPINLYPRLRGFLALRGFPRAPLRLKDFGTDKLSAQVRFKLRKIRELLALLPGYRVIFIGDSGEKDPEIYRRVAKAQPKRVLAVLINRVGSASPRSRRFSGQLLFSSYRGALRYLVKRGLLKKTQ